MILSYVIRLLLSVFCHLSSVICLHHLPMTNKKGFIRLMRRWTKQIRALELFGEKNRLGRDSNLGQAGGNLCLWGPERFFSIGRNAQYTYPLFGRAIFYSVCIFMSLKSCFRRVEISPRRNFSISLATISAIIRPCSDNVSGGCLIPPVF